MPGSVCLSALSIRFSARRCSSSRAPSTIAPSATRRPTSAVVAGDGLELGGGLDQHRGQVDGGVGRLAAGVGAGEQQQVGDEPAHPARGAQGGGGGLALLAGQLLLEQLEVGEHGGQRRAQLVGRVGDELALARQRGLGLRPRGVQRPEHVLERVGELGDLVVGLGLGDRAATGRACARSRRAASVSSAIGDIARRAVARPASRASAAPPSTPSARNTRTRATVALTSDSRRAYWT